VGQAWENEAPPSGLSLSLGEKVAALVLITPTLLNWLALAYAHFSGTAELVDSDGVSHTIVGSRNWNFENIFFMASAACISTVCAHVWLTLGAIARRHKLDQAGAVGSKGYAARLDQAETEARELNWAECAHIVVVAFDFCFASFVVFSAANPPLARTAFGILPGACLLLFVKFVLARARAAVLRSRRTDSVAFTGVALRSSMAVLMVQIVVLARCVELTTSSVPPFSSNLSAVGFLPRFVAFAMNYPVDPLKGDCAFFANMDATNNETWNLAAPINTCKADLFVDGLVRDSNATMYGFYGPLIYQFNGSLVVIYYLLTGCVLYFAARGQGLLHDKLFTELDMSKTHVVALLFWMLATFGAVMAMAVVWAEWSDWDRFWSFVVPAHVCTAFGLIGMASVLWNEAIRVALGFGGGDNRSDMRNATHIIFASMRFVAGRPLPEAIQLREALKQQSVHLQIVELTAGADINQEVFESIEQAEAFLVFGTSNYGEKTSNPACTYFESEYARNLGKKIILLRMIPWEGDGSVFQHTQARVMFGMNSLTLSWMQEEPMPESLPDDIIAALQSDTPAEKP
jgi:hypothetical protein